MTTLTVIGCAVADVNADQPPGRSRRLRYWVTLSAGTYILMQFPVVYTTGVIMAFYAVPAALAGMFGGVLWALATGFPVAVYRLWLGGPGALPGLVHVLVVAFMAGILSPRARVFHLGPWQLAWRSLLIFAVGNLSMLLIPGMGLDIFWTYYPQMMPESALGLALCITLVKMWVTSRRELTRANTMARIDDLTGLSNHRSLIEALDCQPPDRSDCFLLLDLDHFKRINDTYGHLSGDEVLRQVGAVLRRELRDADLVCRYGGEEFAVLMRSCSVSHACEVAERLRVAVAESVMIAQGMQTRVTISGGVVTLDADQPFSNRFALADSLLYQAKLLGRNRVLCEMDVRAQAEPLERAMSEG